MKIYDFVGAPNPKRLRVYVAEKGLAIPVEQVDALAGANRTPEFLRKNPMGRLPLLELDDGTYLPESLAIMEYLEELHPTPSMIGGSPRERARVRALERIAELGVLGPISTVFLHSHPFMTSHPAMVGRVKPSPEAAEYGRTRLAESLRVLDGAIGEQPFVAGARPTIADCTLFAALDFADTMEIGWSGFEHVGRWYAAFKRRPSAPA